MPDPTKTRAAGAASSGSADAKTPDDAKKSAVEEKPETPEVKETPEPQAETQTERFDHDYFVANSVVLFGSGSSSVRGALVAAKKKRLSLAEAERLVKTYSDRPVTFAGQKEQD